MVREIEVKMVRWVSGMHCMENVETYIQMVIQFVKFLAFIVIR